MKVIINADDLGLSMEINEAIKTAIIQKKISSCSIIANGKAFNDVISISRQYPDISFGVHLNIIEFKPLTNDKIFQKNGLIDEQGNFIEGAAFFVKEFTKELKTAIYEEWMAQINKIQDVGITISHIDSHQHTHGIFALKDVLNQVISESGITKVRRRPNTSMIAMFLNHNNNHKVKLDKNHAIKVSKKRFLNRRLRQVINSYKHYFWIQQIKNKAIITDGFMSYGNYLFLFRKYYRWFHFDTLELMCHPGHQAYANEMRSVMADELRIFKSYDLISYNEL